MLSHISNIHSTTGFAPFELIFGHKPYILKSINTLENNSCTDYVRALNHRLYCSRQKAMQNIQQSKERLKSYCDSHSRPVTFNVGDMMYIRCHHKQNKTLSPVWKGPYEIIKNKRKLHHYITNWRQTCPSSLWRNQTSLLITIHS